MKIIGGKPIRFKKNELQLISCCDCCLTHAVLYRVVSKGDVEVIMYRDDHITNELRKEKRGGKKKK